MAVTTATTDDAHLRYVDEDNRVLFIKHDYAAVPKLGSEHSIEGETYRVTSVRHVYDNAVNTLRHVRLTVNPA